MRRREINPRKEKFRSAGKMPAVQGRGFSLVELLMVVAIILLLAALALPRFLEAQKSAYEAAVISFLRTLQSDQESYRLSTGSYADNFNDLGLIASRAPAAPFAPQSPPLFASLFAGFVAVHVHASPRALPGEFPQQSSEQGTAGKAPKKQKRVVGGPGDPAADPRGGTGGGGQGPSGGQPPGKAPAKGGGGGKGSQSGAGGGGPAGGGGQPGGPRKGGGRGGAAAPLAGPASKTNILLKHNYIFTLRRPSPTTWTCTAAPVRDRGNSKFFSMDQTGVARSELGKPAGASSPQLEQVQRSALR